MARAATVPCIPSMAPAATYGIVARATSSRRRAATPGGATRRRRLDCIVALHSALAATLAAFQSFGAAFAISSSHPTPVGSNAIPDAACRGKSSE